MLYWRTLIVLLAGSLLLALMIAPEAADRFPSIPELEVALNLHPGAMLPKEVLSHGVIYRAYYLRGTKLSNGDYDVRLRLR